MAVELKLGDRVMVRGRHVGVMLWIVAPLYWPLFSSLTFSCLLFTSLHLSSLLLPSLVCSSHLSVSSSHYLVLSLHLLLHLSPFTSPAASLTP